MPHLFNFEWFPVLESQRLRLREIAPDDAEAIFRIRGDYLVTRYNGGLPYTSVDQALALIESIREAFLDRRSIRWGITLKGDDTVIGMVGYNYWVRSDFRASVGYDMARAYWGRGLMTEALRAVIDFGFESMGLNRIEADATAQNYASMRVLEKVGFQREGVQNDHYYEEGQFHDLVLFSLLRRQYERLKTG